MGWLAGPDKNFHRVGIGPLSKILAVNWHIPHKEPLLCFYLELGCKLQSTGKSLSEALIFASTNPQYDDVLFIELQVQYMKIPSPEHGENMSYTQIVLNVKLLGPSQNIWTLPTSTQRFWIIPSWF